MSTSATLQTSTSNPEPKSKSDWSSSLYLKFETERTRPARDLLNAVPLANPSRVVDLGCGPGNSTELLAARYPDAKLVGMDSSPNMLEKARKVLPGVEFVEGDLMSWMPDSEGGEGDGKVDLLYSNAVFQWLRRDERFSVVKRLMGSLSEGGVFAMQVPDNYAEPSHRIMREVASLDQFKGVYEGMGGDVGNEKFQSAEEIYDILKPGCESVDIWRTEYTHVMESQEGIVQWFMSTGLRPFLEPLDEEKKEEWLGLYRERIGKAYERRGDGKVLLRFPRLFVVATKG